MAVTFSKHGGLNDEAWKVIDTELSMVIQDTDTEKNKDDELVKSLFNVKNSKKFGEKQGSMTEFGNFVEVSEGDNAIQDDIQMGFSKLIEHTQFIKGFTCTREAVHSSLPTVSHQKALHSFMAASLMTRRPETERAFSLQITREREPV